MITINYAHLCEKAFLSQNGNLNLIGIFERISSPKFPLSFPQLSIVTSLTGDPGEHQLMIKIINKKDQSEITKDITLNITIQNPENQSNPQAQNLRIIGDINNISLQEIGEYEVKIFLNRHQAYAIPFSVEKVKQPIPEGR